MADFYIKYEKITSAAGKPFYMRTVYKAKYKIILMEIVDRTSKSNLLHGETLYLETSYSGNNIFFDLTAFT
jgi:hypothetical protein